MKTTKINFLIQTINKELCFDFSFTLIESVKYQKWFDKTCNFNYQFFETSSEQTKNFEAPLEYIPIGSVEFVVDYLYYNYSKIYKPLNVPFKLLDKKYTQRNIFNGTHKDVYPYSFVKSNDKIKCSAKVITKDNVNMIPEGNYQISSMININSEWRCFVYKNTLVGLSNYSGDFTVFPNINSIKEMISAFSNAPPAYTLDVGVNFAGTFVVECHDFFSCGLYGFKDFIILPRMFYEWFNYYVHKDRTSDVDNHVVGERITRQDALQISNQIRECAEEERQQEFNKAFIEDFWDILA